MTACAARQSNTPIVRCPIGGWFSLVCVFLLFVTAGDSFLFFVFCGFGSGLLISSSGWSIFVWNLKVVPHVGDCLVWIAIDFLFEVYLFEINDLNSSLFPNSVSKRGGYVGITVVESVVSSCGNYYNVFWRDVDVCTITAYLSTRLDIFVTKTFERVCCHVDHIIWELSSLFTGLGLDLNLFTEVFFKDLVYFGDLPS